MGIIFIAIKPFIKSSIKMQKDQSNEKQYRTFEYEVIGDVQGVGFRWSTKQKAQEFGVTGYVENSYDGTVKGVIQGRPDNVKLMEKWLTEEGSRYSSIDKMTKTNEKYIEKLEYQSFYIKY
eukprot:TRINITY_DN32758_c0_g2_i1.p3 TRINITY_DN32758_c0_g2~~TRINITY_DN32758_c0_g2_i1.p3  ORF type:complete len:121 (-),score=23.40 TRINITY_DN32758_c0_g2_i1:153-515(-)